jgi:hypothetical protein
MASKVSDSDDPISSSRGASGRAILSNFMAEAPDSFQATLNLTRGERVAGGLVSRAGVQAPPRWPTMFRPRWSENHWYSHEDRSI